MYNLLCGFYLPWLYHVWWMLLHSDGSWISNFCATLILWMWYIQLRHCLSFTLIVSCMVNVCTEQEHCCNVLKFCWQHKHVYYRLHCIALVAIHNSVKQHRNPFLTGKMKDYTGTTTLESIVGPLELFEFGSFPRADTWGLYRKSHHIQRWSGPTYDIFRCSSTSFPILSISVLCILYVLQFSVI